MTYRFKRAFLERFDRYSRQEQTIIWQAIVQVQRYLEGAKAPHGLGITLFFRTKGLGAVYEARATSAIRILFVTSGDLTAFSFIGNHNEVRQFIRRFR